MIIRLGNSSDINRALALQDKYLLANTHEHDKDQGFVTTRFSADQLLEVIDFDGFFVAEDKGNIVAYLLVCSWDFFVQWPIFKHMTTTFPRLSFNGKGIDTESSFEYGPICIDKAYRNMGIAHQLFECMCTHLQKRFTTGITFINQLNKRSFEAHTRKLGLTVVDEFHFNGHNFYTLAFNTHNKAEKPAVKADTDLPDQFHENK